MDFSILAQQHIEELKAEDRATKNCLERIPEQLYKYKPHEKSMELGYLALLVADIPNWIALTIKDSVIDLATYPRFPLSDTRALVTYYEGNLKAAINALDQLCEDQLKEDFTLKHQDQVLYSIPKMKSISESINHWVHHRGQLTVYMRLNDIAVPSIYGPSADDNNFKQS